MTSKPLCLTLLCFVPNQSDVFLYFPCLQKSKYYNGTAYTTRLLMAFAINVWSSWGINGSFNSCGWTSGSGFHTFFLEGGFVVEELL